MASRENHFNLIGVAKKNYSLPSKVMLAEAFKHMVVVCFHALVHLLLIIVAFLFP